MHTMTLWSPGRVLDRDQVIADTVDQAERLHRLGRVLDQRVLERRIGPRLGDDAGAVVRADLGLVRLDHHVERGRIDIALLGQHGFERAHAQLHLGEFRAVPVRVIVIVVMRHGKHSAGHSDCQPV